ncbi:MAG TPA: CoA transferase, partial [Pseudomonas sp.]|nr:CoA transferase [Pseudomonas sp.]
AGRIYSVADIVADPHYQARDMLLASQLDDGTPVTLPGIVPKLSSTPGGVERPAPTLGQHTDEVLAALGIDSRQRAAWRERGLI